MTIQSFKMGPGTLTFGAVPLDVSCQVKELTIDPSTDEGDSVDVLCGETLEGDETTRWTMSGEVLQDLAAAGLVQWCLTNKAAVQAFVFVPSTAHGRKVTGFVKVRPIGIGGAAKTRPTSKLDGWLVCDANGQAADPIIAALP